MGVIQHNRRAVLLAFVLALMLGSSLARDPPVDMALLPFSGGQGALEMLAWNGTNCVIVPAAFAIAVWSSKDYGWKFHSHIGPLRFTLDETVIVTNVDNGKQSFISSGFPKTGIIDNDNDNWTDPFQDHLSELIGATNLATQVVWRFRFFNVNETFEEVEFRWRYIVVPACDNECYATGSVCNPAEGTCLCTVLPGQSSSSGGQRKTWMGTNCNVFLQANPSSQLCPGEAMSLLWTAAWTDRRSAEFWLFSSNEKELARRWTSGGLIDRTASTGVQAHWAPLDPGEYFFRITRPTAPEHLMIPATLPVTVLPFSHSSCVASWQNLRNASSFPCDSGYFGLNCSLGCSSVKKLVFDHGRFSQSSSSELATPSGYINGMDCAWEISSPTFQPSDPQTFTVSISFCDFASGDILNVFIPDSELPGHWSLLRNFSASSCSSLPITLTIQSNLLRFTFTSDSYSVARGFVVDYSIEARSSADSLVLIVSLTVTAAILVVSIWAFVWYRLWHKKRVSDETPLLAASWPSKEDESKVENSVPLAEDIIEELGEIQLSSTHLLYDNSKDVCPVLAPQTLDFEITNRSHSVVNITLIGPALNAQFTLQIYPGKVTIPPKKSATFKTTLVLRYTSQLQSFVYVSLSSPTIERSFALPVVATGASSLWLDISKLIVTNEDLGHGASADVYLGYFKDIPVAVKIPLRPQLEEVAIKRETALYERLSSPFLLQLIGSSLVTQRLCQVMEFAPFGSLQHVIELRQIPQSLVYKMALDIATGCAYLHAQSLVHCDLKPGNLLVWSLSATPVNCKIGDLGTTRTDEELRLTERVGTPFYMAPENFCCGKFLTNKIDVFAFGVVLFCLAKNTNNPWGMTPLQCYEREVTRGTRPTLPPNFPEAVQSLVASCWAQDASARPTFSDILPKLETLTNTRD